MQNYPAERQQKSSNYRDEDEISLIDVWLIFVRNKKLFFIIVGTVVVLGVIYALLQPKAYEYSATVEIGTIHTFTKQGVNTTLIDSPETVLQKLKQAYIPIVIDEYSKKYPDIKLHYKDVIVSIPKKSQLIVLKALGTKEKSGLYLDLINSVVERLKVDHTKLIDIVKAKVEFELSDQTLILKSLKNPTTLLIKKSGFENEIKRAKNTVTRTSDEEGMLNKKKDRLNGLANLLKGEIIKLKSDIKKVLQQRRKAVKNVDNASKAMTMLMIDNEIRHHRTRLLNLEERLFVNLENDRHILENKIKANQRQLIVQKKNVEDKKDKLTKLLLDHEDLLVKQNKMIDEVKLRLKNVNQTHAIVPAYRSLNPVGIGKKKIVIIGTFLGFMLAIMLIFVREFMRKLQEVIKQRV